MHFAGAYGLELVRELQGFEGDYASTIFTRMPGKGVKMVHTQA